VPQLHRAAAATRSGQKAPGVTICCPRTLPLQIVSFARQSHLAEFVAGDLKGGQLVVVTGPSNRLFATEEDLSELEFVTLLCDGAQEAAEVQAQQGYRGDDVIAYKTAKVRVCVGGGGGGEGLTGVVWCSAPCTGGLSSRRGTAIPVKACMRTLSLHTRTAQPDGICVW
jgi:hypothetical protein